jgi:hypothetical protein
MTPYREAPPAERAAPSATLECVIAGERHGWFGVVAMKLVAMIVAMIVAQMLHVVVAIIVALLGLAWIARDVFRRNDRVVIRTEGERVHFGLAKPLEVSFARLLDVRLDTKTTSKQLAHVRADGLNSIFGGIGSSGRSIQVDQSRIELVVKGRSEPVLLSEEWASSTLTHETIRAIKVFLRKAGWLPLDERPLDDRPKKKKKKTGATS